MNLPTSFRTTVTSARIGFTCTYSGENVGTQNHAPPEPNKALTYYSALEEQERMWITDVDFWPEDICREDRVFGWPPVQHYEQRAFTAEIRNEKIKEAINYESLQCASISIAGR